MKLSIDTTAFDREVREAIKFLEELPGKLDETAHQDAMRAAARVVAAEAKQTTTFIDRTGNLRASIRVRSSPKKHKPGALVIASGSTKAGTKGYHAKLVEYGTVKTKARPFLEPAARGTASKQVKAAAKAAGKSFERVVKELTGAKRPTRRTRRALAAD